MASADTPTATRGLVLIAYDGSELAQLAIEQAGLQLGPGREALVVCVWQPAEVGFVPVGAQQFNADAADQVQKAAEETAAHGASLAEQAGFQSHSIVVETSPTWKGIVELAEQRGASLIVLGSHRRSGIAGRLLGSVAAAVAAHSEASVLIVHQHS